MRIAVLITCHNRKEKTVKCLRSLFSARDCYPQQLELYLFITDDGCTDGTAEAIEAEFYNEKITILRGDGNLFWAGGMRCAWGEALKDKGEWNYYLLLNDDTELFHNLFDEVIAAEGFCCDQYGREGVISGFTCSSNTREGTYGGVMWKSIFLMTMLLLTPDGTFQMCDMSLGNILLIPSYVVDEIGIFDASYIHGAADFDYTLRVRARGIPVLTTRVFVGTCDNDHIDESQKICRMSLKERKRFLSFPTRSFHDRLHFTIRHTPMRCPVILVGYFLLLYCPRIYYCLDKRRRSI